MKNKKVRVIALLICLAIIIYIIISYIIKVNNQNIIGNWTLTQYNVYINDKLDKKINKNDQLKLIIDKTKIISNINIENKNSSTFYYKTSQNKIYYSNTTLKNHLDYDYYEYKIIDKQLFIYQYSSNNLKKEEYIFKKG